MVTNNSHTNHFVLEHFDDTLTMFTGRLLISKVLIEDTGVYTCEAFSEEFPGEFVSANITVWIKGKLRMISMNTRLQ